jgi:hypothetical protein
MKSLSKLAIVTAAAALGLLATNVNAQTVAHGRFAHRNANGGITAGHGTAVRGANGGYARRGRVTTTNGHGQGATASGGSFRTANGAEGSRHGSTQWNDGNVTHQGTEQASGPRGSIQSSGSSQRNADGQFSGSRSTTATGANGGTYQGNTTFQNGSATHTTDATNKNGDTYQGSTTYTKGQGVTHTGTCTNASGATIPCN